MGQKPDAQVSLRGAGGTLLAANKWETEACKLHNSGSGASIGIWSRQTTGGSEPLSLLSEGDRSPLSAGTPADEKDKAEEAAALDETSSSYSSAHSKMGEVEEPYRARPPSEQQRSSESWFPRRRTWPDIVPQSHLLRRRRSQQLLAGVKEGGEMPNLSIDLTVLPPCRLNPQTISYGGVYQVKTTNQATTKQNRPQITSLCCDGLLALVRCLDGNTPR
mmetsp:Transcript_2134/g.3490  ORF Transcript_2134/g.3490 Transcript_2134/m.3490 type:complete len:219 (+) Transcript_2134:24-680(+)